MNNKNTDAPTLQADHEIASGKFLTISNILSLMRVALAVPYAMVMLSDMPQRTIWGVLILLAAVLTDKLDGVFARKYNQITEWGKILDPIADKIGIAVVAFVLVKLEFIPLWFVLIIIGRDFLILVGGLYLKHAKGVVLQSNQMGKWTIGVLAVTMFFAMLNLQLPATIFVWLSVAMLVGSLALYLHRFLHEIKSVHSLASE